MIVKLLPRPSAVTSIYSTLMLRMRAAFELFDVSIALVSEFLMNADLRRVVTINRQVLDRFEEAFFERLRFAFVLADFREQRDLLLGRCASTAISICPVGFRSAGNSTTL